MHERAQTLRRVRCAREMCDSCSTRGSAFGRRAKDGTRDMTRPTNFWISPRAQPDADFIGRALIKIDSLDVRNGLGDVIRSHWDAVGMCEAKLMVGEEANC